MSIFLQEVAADLIQRFGDSLHQNTLVFNNKRPASYIKKYLAEIYKKPFFSPSILTIQEFFAQQHQEKVADFYLQFYSLLNVYNSLLKEEGKASINAANFYPLSKTILSDFAQIDYDIVDANKLFTEMEDIAEIDETFDYLSKEQHDFLSGFWQSYSQLKHKERKKNFIELWRRMAKLYHLFHQELHAKGYTTFGQIYRQVANTPLNNLNCYKPGQGKYIFIGFNALNKAEVTIFKQLQDNDLALFYFDTDLHYLDDNLQEAGYFIRKNIKNHQLRNELQYHINRFKDNSKQVDIYSVQGRNAQAKIINEIFEKPKTTNSELSTTAVILADENIYISALQSIDDDIEINTTMGFPIAQSHVFGIADLWIDIQLALHKNSYLDYHLVESFFNHPLIGLGQEMIEKIQSKIIKENALKIKDSELTKYKGVFSHFFTNISESNALIDGLKKMFDFVIAQQIKQETLRILDSKLLIKLMAHLNRLADTLNSYIAQEKPAFVLQLLRTALLEISVPLESTSLSGLQIMGLLESRNLNFKHVIFLDFNEGIFPKSSQTNTFIPDSIRRAYQLPVQENLDAIAAYMIYRLIQRAEKVSLVYNSVNDGTNSSEVSRFLHQLVYESNFNFNYYNLSFKGSNQDTGNILIVDKKEPYIQKKLSAYLEGEKSLSPSSINKYIKNPLDFYFDNILEINPPKEVTDRIESNQIGSVFHKAMELFYKDEVQKIITKELLEQKASSIESIIQKAFNQVFELSIDFEQYTANQLIVLAVVKEYVEKIIAKDKEDAPFTIKSLEYNFKGKIAIPVGDEIKEILIGGVIDRIDEKDGITRIIDYKTGSDSTKYSSIEKLFDTEDNKINTAMIQMLIYTFLYAEQKQIKNIEPNLFVLKELKSTHFSYRKTVLNADHIFEVKEEFMEKLSKKIAEIFNENIPFKASSIEKNYAYSNYLSIIGLPEVNTNY